MIFVDESYRECLKVVKLKFFLTVQLYVFAINYFVLGKDFFLRCFVAHVKDKIVLYRRGQLYTATWG